MIKSVFVACLFTLLACGGSSTPDSASASQDVTVVRLTLNDWEAGLSKESGLILDVRTPEEFKEGTVEGAKNIDFLNESFTQKVDGLPRDEAIYMFCKSGGRSGKALAQMKQMGFTKVFELEGGFDAWKGSSKAIQVP